MRNVNPVMIELARKADFMTQKELSEALGIAQGHLSLLEKGLKKPSASLVKQMARKLRRSEEFFLEADKFYPSTHAFHRKKRRVPKKVVEGVLAKANIKRIEIKKLMNQIELDDNLPQFDLDEPGYTPESIARKMRAYWRIPRGPIASLVDTLESNGVFVIEYSFGTMDMDAFTLKESGSMPLIFLNKDFPVDRKRRSLAHELGHAVMHDFPTEAMETEADAFASELLTPESEIRPQLNQKLRIHNLADLKRYWKVSMQSLIMRAAELGRIDDKKKTSLFVQMSQRGYRRHEPIDLPQEPPTLLKEVIEVHKKTLGMPNATVAKIVLSALDRFKEEYFPERTNFRVVQA